ncbi:TetR/AcrR family transcriptional regulator [Streptomyces sp. DSM 44917]|uniref:TetR/AcrR family transcriptional regulator n=1 Tax=Streptomyces boetiae TaxID=3075541 RepID=A0ABU2L1F9_9ACTN|nr:TetR/AcrR family transcriptional regulator [Streptomyces sp. DSM 44917]MDT0305401.1 TetR/AcrR family transcriptional regulator [Streptomyces sp. DSM 44917]
MPTGPTPAAGPRGRGRPRNLPAEEFRVRVLAAARRAFAVHGMQASVEGIARDAGVSRRSVYEQFGDKRALFGHVLEDLRERADRAIGEAFADDREMELTDWVRNGYRWLFRFLAENPEARAIGELAEELGHPVSEYLRGRYAEAVGAASRRRWAEAGIDIGRVDVLLMALYSAMTDAAVKLKWPGARPEDEDVINLLTEFTAGGLIRLAVEAPDALARLRPGAAG